MDKCITMKKTLIIPILLVFISCSGKYESKEEKNNNDILLKNYRPESIYNILQEDIQKPASPIIDMHSHPYATNIQELDRWVKTMDKLGIEKTILLTYNTGAPFDSLVNVYGKYPDKFDLWCGFDYTDYEQEGWVDRAIKELERCKAMGAKGVGELGDKGLGLFYSMPSPAYGLHVNDSRIQPLLRRCGELNMPINIHVAEPYWMYLPADNTNDGLMNGLKWKIDTEKEGIILHQELINTLEEAVKENPGTTFIACHFANCSYDLSILGSLLDNYSNLYTDISARFAETSPIPRYMKKFYSQYQDRILYGTDMGLDEDMYKTTFRILESHDEHFYDFERFDYHWPLHGFGLDSPILSKVYYENAKGLIN